jgi:excisionase family DNA binding protein
MAINKAVQRLDSLNNAADYAGVHVKTIRRWISAGRLTGYRLGPRLIKVDLDQLDAMLTPIGGHV